jgi:hypothetical protein
VSHPAASPSASTPAQPVDAEQVASRPLPARPEGLVARVAALSDARLTFATALALFALSAWPLLLVALPPYQDLPNHVATAHIVAHPELYRELAFNGFFKSNGLLTLWFHVAGGLGLFAAARVFTAIVLLTNAIALPVFLLHFCGRRRLLVGTLFAWPLVHSFSVSMGFLNFAFGFALSLILLTVLDRQRERPTVARALGIGALSGLLWYAHPFPLAVVGGLVGLHVVTRPGWPARIREGIALLLPLVPAGLLAVVAAQHHLVKVEHTTAAAGAASYSYLNPLETLEHLWTDVSGAFTYLGAMTVVPAILLPVFAWQERRKEGQKERRQERQQDRLFFSRPALAILAAAYIALPVMASNWWYLNCRLVPFLWAGLLLRVPSTLPRSVTAALAVCAVAFSVATGVDYRRLDRDRAEFTAGLDAVPERATLLPLMFKRSKTSTFTASLNHAWGYYTVEKDTSAPLAFAVERSYPITYREFPPRALIPPALDRFAEQRGTPAQVCKSLGRWPVDEACTAAWRELWNGFWREAEPRFSHLLTWAIPAEARPMIPARYRRIFAAGALEIYARDGGNYEGGDGTKRSGG